jgi:HAD superfamily hydrolase (TIGR01509 family)
MDGLTVDTEPIWFHAERLVAERLGAIWTQADARHCVGGPVPKMARYIADRAGGVETWEAIADAVIDEVVRLLNHGVALKAGVAPLIAGARAAGVPVALVSGSPRRVVDAVVELLDHDYDVIVSADDAAHTKPAPEPYLKAAAELGVQIAWSVALEDSVTGMTSAEAAGAFVIMVPDVAIEAHSRRVVLSSLEGITLDGIDELLRMGR